MQEPITQDPQMQDVHEPVLDQAPDPAAGTTPEGPPPLRRDMSRRMLGGVCAGIARAYDYDVTVVRVVALLLTLPGGFGLVLYAALWALMPADTGTPPQTSSSTPTSNAEDLAERIRLAADELAAATRAAAEAARVAAEQLSEVARAASAAGRESWESRPSAQAAAASPPAPTEASSPASAPADTTAVVTPLPPIDPAMPDPPESLDRPPTNPPANPPAV